MVPACSGALVQQPCSNASCASQPLVEHVRDTRMHTRPLLHPATLLLSENVNPKIVQEVLGHATISQTMDTYSHVLPDMQDGAVAAMESTIS
jgi:integrase